MSAYIVDKNHILFLVESAMSRALSRHDGGSLSWHHNDQHHAIRCGNYDRAADVANMLWRENVASVSARYPNESSATLPGPIDKQFVIKPRDFQVTFDRIDPVQVLKSCDCFEYQSCEHDGWKTSEARCFISALRKHAHQAVAGYEDSIWGAPEPGRGISLMAMAATR